MKAVVSIINLRLLIRYCGLTAAIYATSCQPVQEKQSTTGSEHTIAIDSAKIKADQETAEKRERQRRNRRQMLDTKFKLVSHANFTDEFHDVFTVDWMLGDTLDTPWRADRTTRSCRLAVLSYAGMVKGFGDFLGKGRLIDGQWDLVRDLAFHDSPDFYLYKQTRLIRGEELPDSLPSLSSVHREIVDGDRSVFVLHDFDYHELRIRTYLDMRPEYYDYVVGFIIYPPEE